LRGSRTGRGAKLIDEAKLLVDATWRRIPDELLGLPSGEDEGVRSEGVPNDWQESLLIIMGTGGGVDDDKEETIW